jgi:hypothetical protein
VSYHKDTKKIIIYEAYDSYEGHASFLYTWAITTGYLARGEEAFTNSSEEDYEIHKFVFACFILLAEGEEL